MPVWMWPSRFSRQDQFVTVGEMQFNKKPTRRLNISLSGKLGASLWCSHLEVWFTRCWSCIARLIHSDLSSQCCEACVCEESLENLELLVMRVAPRDSQNARSPSVLWLWCIVSLCGFHVSEWQKFREERTRDCASSTIWKVESRDLWQFFGGRFFPRRWAQSQRGDLGHSSALFSRKPCEHLHAKLDHWKEWFDIVQMITTFFEITRNEVVQSVAMVPRGNKSAETYHWEDSSTGKNPILQQVRTSMKIRWPPWRSKVEYYDSSSRHPK